MSEALNPENTVDTVFPDRPLLLREAREAAGLHIAALAAALKVPVKKLEALEAGRYSELPDMTFARALASSACRQLKIDSVPVLAQIPLAHTPELGDSPQAINEPFKGGGQGAAIDPAGWFSRPAVMTALVLLLGALVLVFLPKRESAPQPDAVMPPPVAAGDAPAAAPDASSSATVVEPAASATTDNAAASAAVPPVAQPASGALSSPDANALPGGVSTATSTTTLAATSTSSAAVSAATTGSLLVIRATAESWVEVVNGSGEVVTKRLLKTGDVIDFSTAPPYSVVLGRADAAEVTVRGQPFDTAPFARNSVARFEVK